MGEYLCACLEQDLGSLRKTECRMQETVYLCPLVPLLPLLGFAAGLWAHVIPEYCSQRQRTELKEHSWLETKPWFVSSSQAGHFCRVYETPGHCVCECNVCMCVTGSLEFNSDTCTKTQNLPEAQPAATCHASTTHTHTVYSYLASRSHCKCVETVQCIVILHLPTAKSVLLLFCNWSGLARYKPRLEKESVREQCCLRVCICACG